MDKLSEKKRCVLFFFCIFFCVSLFFYNFRSKAMEDIDSELIILVDASETMKNSWDDVARWVNEIGIYAQNTGIRVHLKWFGGKGEEDTLYNGRIESDNIIEYIDRLKKIGPDKLYTDQKGAIKEAIKIMDESNASKKCIVMLSDGRLDYVENEDEEIAKKEFEKEVNKFSAGDNQSVVLIEFEGTIVGEDTYIFGNLDEKVEWKKIDKDKNEILMKEILSLLFEKLGVKINKISFSMNKNQIQFNSAQDAFRIIVMIEILDYAIEKDYLNSIIVERDDSEIKPVVSQQYNNFIYLIFEEDGIKEYKYKIVLSDENVSCRGIYMRKNISDTQPITTTEDDIQNQIDEGNENEVKRCVVKIGEKIDIEKEFGISSDNADTKYNIKIKDEDGNEEEVALKGFKNSEEYKCNEGKLTFFKEGEYKVTIEPCEGNLEYYYIVEKKKWWERLFSWLK